jgi:hypothetical protein
MKVNSLTNKLVKIFARCRIITSLLWEARWPPADLIRIDVLDDSGGEVGEVARGHLRAAVA